MKSLILSMIAVVLSATIACSLGTVFGQTSVEVSTDEEKKQELRAINSVLNRVALLKGTRQATQELSTLAEKPN